MANDFSTDPRCKALWRFESGALTTDSKGSNTLTPTASAPTVDTTNFQEGASSAHYDRSNSQGHSIADANLVAGFPLKSGDTAKKATFCFWYRPSAGANAYSDKAIFGKWKNGATNKLSLFLDHYYGSLSLGWGFNDSGADWWGTGLNFTEGKPYHIAVVIDGVAKTAKIRVWDGSTVTNYPHTYYYELNVSDGAFEIGHDEGANCLHGNLDEFVAFNDLLSDTEIDAIRNGVFPLPPKIEIFQAVAQVEWESPPLIEVSQVIGQAEWEAPPINAVFQVIGQAEYQIPPLIKVPQIIGQVEYRQFDPGLYVKQFIVQVEYQEIPPLAYRRKFPVPDARTAWQSQAGRRQFPVVQ